MDPGHAMDLQSIVGLYKWRTAEHDRCWARWAFSLNAGHVLRAAGGEEATPVEPAVNRRHATKEFTFPNYYSCVTCGEVRMSTSTKNQTPSGVPRPLMKCQNCNTSRSPNWVLIPGHTERLSRRCCCLCRKPYFNGYCNRILSTYEARSLRSG